MRISFAVLLITAMCAASGHAQITDSFFELPSSQLDARLSELAEVCNARGTWVNATEANPLAGAEGHLAFLHFGNFEDPASLGTIRDLNDLQLKRHDLRVILYLNPRYHNAKSTDAVLEHLSRHGIALPVLLDTAGVFSQCMQVESEASTAILSPEGRVLGEVNGGLNMEGWEELASKLTSRFEGRFPKNREPFYGLPPARREATPVLRFPTGLAAQPIEDLIFISDALSNRIIGTTSAGNTVYCLGSERGGYVDGTMAEARFHGPRGLAFDLGEGVLYVADTYNHRIRKIDFALDEVSTVLGDGSVGNGEINEVTSTLESVGYPLDLVLDGNELYFTTAGSAAGLWVMDTRTGSARKVVSADELIEDGTPVGFGGLTTDPSGSLFFSDSYHSVLRYFENGKVTAAAGKGSEHGHGDGRKNDIRFQFPNGLTEKDGTIYVADTYNHAIRAVQPFRPRSSTVVGKGEKGFRDGPAHNALLNQPRDVVYMNGKFFISDSGNGAIRIFDPESGRVSTLVLHHFECVGHDKGEVIMDLRDGPEITINGHLTELEFVVDLGEDWEMDPGGFSQATLLTRRKGFVLRDSDLSDGAFSAISVFEDTDRGDVAFDLRLFVRNVHDGRQYYRALTLNHPVVVSKDAPTSAKIVIPVSVWGEEESGETLEHMR